MQAYKCVPHQGFCDNVEKFGQICDLFFFVTFYEKELSKRKIKVFDQTKRI